MLWLYLHFPMLQLNGLHKCEVNEQPIIVVNEQTNEVVQCNTYASQAGIKLGMGLATSAALVKKLHVVAYQKAQEEIYLQSIAQILYGVTADIAFDKPNGLYLRIGNMLSLYSDVQFYWKTIAHQLKNIGFHAHYATSYNPFAAKLLALSKANIIDEDNERLHNLFVKLPVSLLATTPKNIEDLNRIGVRDIGQLLALPRKELALRFERNFNYYLSQLAGDIAPTLTFYQPKPRFERSLELLYEISYIAILEKPFLVLLNALQEFLLLRGLATHHIQVCLSLRDSENLFILLQSAQPLDNAQQWLELAKLRFEHIVLTAPVIAVAICCEHLAVKQSETANLFQGKKTVLTHAELISQLQAKLGDENVCALSLANDHRPEMATNVKPLHMANYRAFKNEGSHKTNVSHFPSRPSYLLPTPEPLTESVTIIHGPERIEAGWWQQSIGRDYFVARNAQGQWCWLFREKNHQWFIHGYFA